MELGNDLATVVRTFGSGAKGFADGDAETAQFNEPQGLALLPAASAASLGYHVVVADTVNHRLRSINLETGAVGTLAGNGVQRLLDAEQARTAADNVADADAWISDLGNDPLNTSLSSPWDVLWSEKANAVVIAMAGTHQIFSFDPSSLALRVFAGTGLEGLADGKPGESWFAQSSGPGRGRPGQHLGGRFRDLRAAPPGAGRGRFGRGRRVRHRRRALRLRFPRRRRGPGTPPAPAGRCRTAGRLGRHCRHLQRRGAPLRPGHRHG